MGNASQLCANGSTQETDNKRTELEKKFLDKSPPQTKKKALINLFDEQYGHQLLPNLKELHKYDRAKIEKVIYKSSSPENHQYKSHSPKQQTIQESKNTQNKQKIKQKLRQFNQLQTLKQKCKKIQYVQNQFFRKKPNEQQFKLYNQSLQVHRQKNQTLTSKPEIGQVNIK